MAPHPILDRFNARPMLVEDADLAADLVAELLPLDRVAVDFETTALHPVNGDARVLSVYAGPDALSGGVLVFDLARTGLDALRPLFRRELIAHSAQFESLWAAGTGLAGPRDQGGWHCTKMAYAMVDASTFPDDDEDGPRGGASLADAVRSTWGIDLSKDLQGPENWIGRAPLTADHVNYAAADAVAAWHLLPLSLQVIEDQEMQRAYDTARHAIPAVAEMELHGLPVNVTTLRDCIAGWRARYTEALADLLADPEFPRKPLPKYKLERGDFAPPVLTGKRVAQWVCLKLPVEVFTDWPLTDSGAHIQVGPKILRRYAEYKALHPLIKAAEMGKLLNTYGAPMLDRVLEAGDNRLRGSTIIAAAKTGRTASANPNLQNLPKWGLKHSFEAPAGRVLVSVDYGGIELRVAAAIAGDVDLLAAFDSKEGLDPHRLTASEMFKIDPTEVDGPHRQTGKRVNFLSLYGGGGFGLRQKMIEDAVLYGDDVSEIPDAQTCGGWIDAFWSKWRHLDEWRQAQWVAMHALVREGARPVQRTPLGRIVPCDPSKKQLAAAEDRNKRRPTFSPTLTLNAPIQGGAAECALMALPLVLDRLTGSAFLVGFVHDEVIAECAENEAEATLQAIQDGMTEGALRVLPNLPQTKLVEGGYSQRWQELSADKRVLHRKEA